jgi:hypothetical protein
MKKILLSLVAFTITATTILAQTVPNYVPTNGLVGYWGFNGNANDESGNGNNGTVSGATLTSDRYGNTEKAYLFNGVDNFILANNISLSANFTISSWILANNEIVTSDQFTLITSGATFIQKGSSNNPCNYSDFALGLRSNSNANNVFCNNIFFEFEKGNGCSADFFSTCQPEFNTFNSWHQVTYVADGSTLKLFFDGNLINTLNFNTSLNDAGFPLSIGARCVANTSDVYGFWNGKIDDIGIWNRALTDQEIEALYQPQSCNLTANISPSTALVNAGANAQFTASSSDPTATFQWQSNLAHFGWQNVPSNNFYSGATTNSLTVNNVQLGNHNQPFRVIATAGNCVDTSATAFIQLTDTCVNTVIDTNFVNQTIYDTTHVTVTDTNYVNQTIYDTTYVTVTDTNYVTIHDTVTTYISVTDTLFIDINTVGLNNNPVVNTIRVYPNPSNSILNLNYGNYATLNNYRVKITNSLGQIIYDQAITQQSETLDLSTFGGNGIYYLNIINPQGNIIETRKIVLQ